MFRKQVFITKKGSKKTQEVLDVLGRPKLSWENSIRKDFEQITREDQGIRDWKKVAEYGDE